MNVRGGRETEKLIIVPLGTRFCLDGPLQDDSVEVAPTWAA